MHLKSLTLKGFKSFAQATTFRFEPGVTAVVGPNGSGKSNVVDALAWVMGEQGAKTLRGGKMEDVIFAGTSTRGPLGRAEVKLTIDNSDGALPIEYSEVTISRTLFRNGSSEYAINGEGCRLLDVQELLSDSGLGREMHVIVGQGQLDAVLRATPEDRRGFIEEAAGILKHRRRKEKTLRKLEAMETNLTRLSDLAGEIRRQLKPLGRQAEVARAAQGIAAEARDAKARILADDIALLRRELDDLSKGDSERHSERIVLQEQLEQRQLRIQRIEQDQQGDELDGARRVTLALEASRSRLRGLASQANQRLTFLATQAEAPEQTHRLSQSSVDEAAEEAAALAALVPAAKAGWTAAGVRTQQAKNALDALDEHIAAQSALVSKHDLELSKLRGQATAAAQKHDVLAAEVRRREQAVAQAETRAAEAAAALSQFEDALEAESDADALPEAGLDASYQEAQDRQAAAEVARDELRDRLHTLERERSGLDARISALASALDQRDATGQLLADATRGIRGRVADHVRVDDGYEAAVGAALGTLAEALLADEHDAAGDALEAARAGDLGRVDIVVAQSSVASGAAAIKPDDAPSVPGAVHALDVVRAPDGVLGVLARTYIADSLDSARTAAQVLRTAWGAAYTIVTRDGEVLTEYTLTGGSGLAPSRIELNADRTLAEERRAAVDREITDATAELELARDAASRAKVDAATAFARLREADARAASISQQRNKLTVRAESARSEAERVQQALTAVAGSEAESAEAAERAAHAFASVEAQPRPMLDVGERSELVSELDRRRAEEVELRLQLETMRERVRAAGERTKALTAQLAAERLAAEEAARRAVLRARQVARAEHVAAALPDLIDACDRSLNEARMNQLAAEQERAKHSQELTLLRSEDAELRERLRALTERAHGAELKSYERKLGLSSLLERAGNELGLVEDVLLAEYGPDQPVPVTPPIADVAGADRAAGEAAGGGEDDGFPDPVSSPEQATAVVESVPYVRAEQERRLVKAERRLAELGRINPLALEEFAALEQRHKFLSEQLTDLARTRADLMKIIDELDHKMEGIFAAAFADTKAAFAEVFPVLFPGGSGEIALTDPEHMLSTGIEMTVRPAGKKVERLSLLSGGERSLAAVAWLIAIFQARPSPFYIMDEVEAALDDANLGRLLEVFATLREHSQLIIITHQKRTMEIADALYGVSMRQDGISAVVGQRIGRDSAGETGGVRAADAERESVNI
ncbi:MULTISPECIES: chromosome segregation protein SMC [unclassified Leucobacter]|uniref:chromosome segregation protein SMC n=1 Tax=unclassified Leucobacter TaxID=2621730 RepID=UPI00165D43E5|nr:chromosome segregation protein SMC [Leucobacter sp. cx-87]